MKFTATTTTSSILCATLALSPSLVRGVPTSMEAPNSPNLAGTPSVSKFPSSPMHSALMSHAPAMKTGPGSPTSRRSVPPRMFRSRGRELASRDDDPLAAVSAPLSSIVGQVEPLLDGIPEKVKPVVSPVLDPVTGLPVVGKTVDKLANKAGLRVVESKVNAVDSTSEVSTPGETSNGLNGLDGEYPADAGDEYSGLSSGRSQGFPQPGSPYPVPDASPDADYPFHHPDGPHDHQGHDSDDISSSEIVGETNNAVFVEDSHGVITMIPIHAGQLDQVDHAASGSGLFSAQSSSDSPPALAMLNSKAPVPSASPSALVDAASSVVSAPTSSVPVHPTVPLSLLNPSATPPALAAENVTPSDLPGATAQAPTSVAPPTAVETPDHLSEPVLSGSATAAATPVSDLPVHPTLPTPSQAPGFVSALPSASTVNTFPAPSIQKEDVNDSGPSDGLLLASSAISGAKPDVSPPNPTHAPTAHPNAPSVLPTKVAAPTSASVSRPSPPISEGTSASAA
ncbi:hypothetical protein K439DRAFT_1658552 [Ramaria rubella]|nr:hypothetical protein K439DRAFT_1658552 [Ramaria rubella]